MLTVNPISDLYDDIVFSNCYQVYNLIGVNFYTVNHMVYTVYYTRDTRVLTGYMYYFFGYRSQGIHIMSIVCV